ncbi:hypothetical protein [Nevskia sp.]|uniref:hypothetical protein n=1 Tax=Nevskia sp. TaxID=1929292 RepID=UPI0025E977EE|nr:hypothetical protein [Nevskia sp.]
MVMCTETPTLIRVLRDRMEKMTPDERLELAGDLLDGYCEHCGYETHGRTCHCTNDE